MKLIFGFLFFLSSISFGDAYIGIGASLRFKKDSIGMQRQENPFGLSAGYAWHHFAILAEYNKSYFESGGGNLTIGGTQHDYSLWTKFSTEELSNTWLPYLGAGIGGNYNKMSVSLNKETINLETKTKIFLGIALGIWHKIFQNWSFNIEVRGLTFIQEYTEFFPEALLRIGYLW